MLTVSLPHQTRHSPDRHTVACLSDSQWPRRMWTHQPVSVTRKGSELHLLMLAGTLFGTRCLSAPPTTTSLITLLVKMSKSPPLYCPYGCRLPLNKRDIEYFVGTAWQGCDEIYWSGEVALSALRCICILGVQGFVFMCVASVNTLGAVSSSVLLAKEQMLPMIRPVSPLSVLFSHFSHATPDSPP